MEGIIIIGIIAFAIFYFRKPKKIFYSIAIIDIFLRVFNYLITHIEIKGITEYVAKYLPESIPAVIQKYTEGMLCDILVWVYVVCIAVFLFYAIRDLFLSKK